MKDNKNNCKVKKSRDLEKKYIKESFTMLSVGLSRPSFNEWLALDQLVF